MENKELTMTARANLAKDKVENLVIAALVEAGYNPARIGPREVVVVDGGVNVAVDVSSKAMTAGKVRPAFDLEAAVAAYAETQREAETAKAEKEAEKARKEAEKAAKKTAKG